jgi:hypothetical protein
MRRERRQPDFVKGALELARRDSQRAGQGGQRQWTAITALDRETGAQVELGHRLNGGLAMRPRVGWRRAS